MLLRHDDAHAARGVIHAHQRAVGDQHLVDSVRHLPRRQTAIVILAAASACAAAVAASTPAARGVVRNPFLRRIEIYGTTAASPIITILPFTVLPTSATHAFISACVRPRYRGPPPRPPRPPAAAPSAGGATSGPWGAIN